jgi:hypothetical protein
MRSTNNTLLGLIALAILTIFLHSGCVDAVVGNPGHDRPYYDLPNMPVTLGAGKQADACAALCDGEADCVAWAFAPADCGGNNQCWLKAGFPPVVPASCRTSGTKDVTLLPKKFASFPLGSIMPQGWLKNQLQLQADGLCGYLSEFWPSINQSAWIGHAGGDTFERVPYWLNGLVPLAFQLNDPALFAQMHRYLDYIINNQAADGWIGPTCCDPWPRFPMLLALAQYSEANKTDTRIVPALWKFMNRLRTEIEKNPLSSWAQYRTHDLILVIHWLLDNYPQGQEQVLLDLAEVVYQQGFDWGAFFISSQFPHGPCVNSCPSLATHGVNNGQALKSGAVWYRQSKDSSDVDSTYQRIERLYKYHGLASGIFGCDEHLAGNMPSHGSELCTVVETMYSFEEMYSILGDPVFGDYVEKLTFNALPATMTADMWAHQYLQQANEINAQHNDPNIWTTDGPDSNIYGLEPNFGCCTANFPQGWPKFTSHIYLRSTDNGVLAALYSPSVLTTVINNNRITISQTTSYPFDDVVTFDVSSDSAFPFYVRIPGWASGATVQVGSSTPSPTTPGAHFRAQLPSGKSQVVLRLNMNFKVERRYNNAAAISLGPIVFALNIPSKWTQLKYYAFNSSDWQVLPSAPYAFALNISDKDPASYLKLVKKAVGPMPFSETGSPLVVTANARPIVWGVANNALQEPPVSPVQSSSPPQQVTLLPYGATKLRILEIPTLN